MPLLIVGAGAAGLCAALAAKEAGVDAVVIERDAVPLGLDRAVGRAYSRRGHAFPARQGHRRQTRNCSPPISSARRMARPIAAVVDAVRERCRAAGRMAGGPLRPAFRRGRQLQLSRPFRAAHAWPADPHRAGTDRPAAQRGGSNATSSFYRSASPSGCWSEPDGRIRGVESLRGDGTRERIGCAALILACNGYGGNPELVRRFIPEMADALYFGHPGNRGDAVLWGEALGAQLAHLGAYQGHGSVATPHNILISWAAIMQGGIQVNSEGRRFCDESRGYSEQATDVLRQPGGIALDVFDARIASVARQFEDFREAERAGALLTGQTVAELADKMHVPAAALVAEWTEVERLKAANAQDRFGRKFAAEQACARPFHAVKVTGALFHTQGGLAIDAAASSARTGRYFPTCSRPAARRPACRASGRLSVGQRAVDRDRAWPIGGEGCGEANIVSLASSKH